MKVFVILISCLLNAVLFAQSVFINEIHYDNTGTDADEGIEIAAPSGTDLSCYDIVLYNGNNNEAYLTENLSGVVSDQGYGFGTIWFPIVGIQNGDNDGIVLYDNCNSSIVQFLSYEGYLNANGGVADGLSSIDIGVAEIGSDVGSSLQLIGTGTQYADFIWSGPSVGSAGAINAYQSFGGTAGTTVFINPSSVSVNEGDGTLSFDVSVINLTAAVNVAINVLASSTATENDDFTLSNNQVSFTDLSIPSQNISVEIDLNDDYMYEMMETIELEITTADAAISNGFLTVNVFDNDQPATTYTPYSIADVSINDADGVPTLLDENVELNGIVYGLNLFTNGGISTTIIDVNGDGINVFTLDDLGINPQEGDNITVQGSILQYNGLTEIGADNVILNGTGNTLANALEVTELNEATESQYIAILVKTIPGITENGWEGNGNSFNVKFLQVGSNDTIVARIDDATPLASLSYSNLFSDNTEYILSGIGGQFDSSSPYLDGYQIFPMYESHIVLTVSDLEDNFNQANIEIVRLNQAITFNTEKQIESLALLNLNGQTLLQTNGNSLNVSQLATNIYMAFLKIEGQYYSKRVYIKN